MLQTSIILAFALLFYIDLDHSVITNASNAEIPDSTDSEVSVVPIRIDTVRGKHVHSRYEGEWDYKFPVVRSVGNASIADSINADLRREVLSSEDDDTSALFYNPQGDSDDYSGLYYLSFSELPGPKNTLVLRIESEWCAAYCVNGASHYCYSLWDGARIRMSDMLTASGQRWLMSVSTAGKKARIERFLDSLKGQITAGGFGSDSRSLDRTLASIDMYEFCLEHAESWSDTSGLEYIDFHLTPDSLVIYRGRCSNHAMRALDDLWYFRSAYGEAELKSHLTPLGRRLFRLGE